MLAIPQTYLDPLGYQCQMSDIHRFLKHVYQDCYQEPLIAQVSLFFRCLFALARQNM